MTNGRVVLACCCKKMKSLFSSVVVLFVTCILAKQDNVFRFESQKKIAPDAEFLHLMTLLKKGFVSEKYKPISLFNKLGLDHSTRLLGFNWKDCGNSSDSIAHVTSLSISPDPLELTGNINLKVTGNIVSTLSQNLTAALTIKKKVAGIPIEIPCVDNVGSCTYTNICGLLNQITECPKFLTDHGIPCKCPLNQGDYKLPNTTISINLPAGPPGGDYAVTAVLTDVVKQKTACLHVEFTLE